MVAELVVKEFLSDQMIAAGSDLVRQLDEAGVAVSGALWFYDVDSNSWRLIFASPEVSDKGVKAVYKEVQSVLRGMPEDHSIPLKDISVVDSNDQLISLMRVALKTGDGIHAVRFTRNMINGVLIEDAHIYRLT